VPSLEEMASTTDGRKPGPLLSNEKLRFYAQNILSSDKISDNWREFVKIHTSKDYFVNFMEVFGEAVFKIHPHLEKKLGFYKDLKVGVRHRDKAADVDVLLESEVCVDTPTIGQASSVKTAHLDGLRKLAICMFYLKEEADDSEGGDFTLYRHVRGKEIFKGQRFIDTDKLEEVKKIPYEHNNFLMFLNSKDSIHGVTPRRPTSFSRWAVNLVVELPEPIFSIEYERRFVQKAKSFIKSSVKEVASRLGE